MLTPDNQLIRIVPTVDLTALREAVLDEDGHIRELSAGEWRRFSWDSTEGAYRSEVSYPSGSIAHHSHHHSHIPSRARTILS